MSTYALIADDLTGALDAGAGFVRHGLRAVLPFSGRPEDAPDADVVLVNTETREAPDASLARAAARAAARRLVDAGITRVYKKMDSVLRGYPGAELAGVLDVLGGRALVAPAFPAQGRTTVGKRQLLDGRPLELYAGDLRMALAPAAERCDIRDATSDDDLAEIAHQAAREGYAVWCGTAGLAAQVPPALGLRPEHGALPVLPSVEQVVILAGTRHPVTNVQLDRMHGAPRARVLVEGRRFGSAAEVVAALQGTAEGLPLDGKTALILTGGETALIVCRALGAQSIEIAGEALPGIPVGRLRLAQGSIVVATKSGGFGGPDALSQTAAWLRQGQR